MNGLEGNTPSGGKVMSDKLYQMGSWLNGYEEAEENKDDEEEANDLNPTYEKTTSGRRREIS